MLSTTQELKIYTISQLNRLSRALLEDSFQSIWIEGEISNCSKPASGHLYFSLKDADAQIRCAMFKSRNQSLNFLPKDGMHVLLRGNVSLYEPRGDYQFIADKMELAGDGVLQRQFEQLKTKLSAEGLFSLEYKKTFPAFPKTVGVITSATGAAIQDILKVFNKRFPSIQIIIYPTQVQGKEAASQIVAAIELANQRKECDALILARGGGSIEDLWPFNEEIVARAIFASDLAIVSGIGHEVDFTIADFVADHRAPTPSAAAEFLSPDQEDLLQQIKTGETRLIGSIKKNLHLLTQHLHHLQKRIRSPQQYLQDLMQRFDHAEQLLKRVMQNDLKNKMQQLKNHMRALHAVSPLAVLERGYSITLDANDRIITDFSSLKTNDKVQTRLSNGSFESVITHLSKNDNLTSTKN